MAKDNFLYQSLYNDLRLRILNSIYPANTKLPAESEIKQEFAVSSITIKKAMGLLAQDGLVRRVPGKGTFVIQNNTIEAKVYCLKSTSPIIGFVVENMSTPFGLDLVLQIYALAEAAGYKLCIRFSFGNHENETKEIEFLRSLGVCGMLIMPSQGRQYNSTILKLVLEDFPVIFVDKKLGGIGVPSVRTDNAAAIKTLVNHLVGQGKKNIGLISYENQSATSLEEHRNGFIDAISQHRLTLAQECLLPTSSGIVSTTLDQLLVKSISDYILANKNTLDSLVCADFYLARHATIAAKGIGLDLEKDLPLCCIDEDYLSPKGYTYSHIKQDECRIAEKAFNLLLQKISGKYILQEDFLVPGSFHEKK